MSYQKSVEYIAEFLSVRKASFLVTGATGLIGSCIIDVLVAANKNGCEFSIYALSRSKEKVKNRFCDNVIPVIQDITDAVPADLHFDYIFHCASNADPKSYALRPSETVLTNIIGTKNILDYCKQNKNTRVLFTSSFEVYGCIDGVSLYSENMSGIIDQTVLRNGYPESKRCCELLLRSYVEEYGIKAVIARLSSVYGPTMLKNDSKAHAQFINNILKEENIVLKSKGEQRRCYTYVVDAASALFALIFKGRNGEIYNVANEDSVTSIAELASLCAKIAGTEVVSNLPDNIEEKGFSKTKDCILDTKKLQELGWHGTYTLEAGLRETVEELKDE